MIYFIQAGDGGPIKIGYTQGEAASRVRDLQTGNAELLRLLHSMPGDMDLEAELHRLFERYRIRGEWFHPDPKLLSFLVVPVPKAGWYELSTGLNGWGLPKGIKLPDMPTRSQLCGALDQLWETAVTCKGMSMRFAATKSFYHLQHIALLSGRWKYAL